MGAASYSGAKAAIRTRIEANWLATRITYQNEVPAEPWPPSTGAGDQLVLLPWVNLEVLGTGSEIYGQGTPGNQLWHYTGLIYVHVFTPVGSSDALASQYADQIGEIFRGAKFYDTVQAGCYVRCWAPRQDGGGSADDDGAWFRVSMICDFEYWHRG